MKRLTWEYKIYAIDQPMGFSEFDKWLNSKGADGWELIHIEYQSVTGISVLGHSVEIQIFYFKRPKGYVNIMVN
jgi:hypothetical protein